MIDRPRLTMSAIVERFVNQPAWAIAGELIVFYAALVGLTLIVTL